MRREADPAEAGRRSWHRSWREAARDRTAPSGALSARHWTRIVLLLVGLAGCAAGPTGPVQSRQPPPDLPSRSATVAGTALSVVGTPLFLVLKAAVCAASAGIAVPLAAVSALADSHSAVWAREEFAEGVGTNCGPPYYLTFTEPD